MNFFKVAVVLPILLHMLSSYVLGALVFYSYGCWPKYYQCPPDDKWDKWPLLDYQESVLFSMVGFSLAASVLALPLIIVALTSHIHKPISNQRSNKYSKLIYPLVIFCAYGVVITDPTGILEWWFD